MAKKMLYKTEPFSKIAIIYKNLAGLLEGNEQVIDKYKDFFDKYRIIFNDMRTKLHRKSENLKSDFYANMDIFLNDFLKYLLRPKNLAMDGMLALTGLFLIDGIYQDSKAQEIIYDSQEDVILPSYSPHALKKPIVVDENIGNWLSKIEEQYYDEAYGGKLLLLANLYIFDKDTLHKDDIILVPEDPYGYVLFFEGDQGDQIINELKGEILQNIYENVKAEREKTDKLLERLRGLRAALSDSNKTKLEEMINARKNMDKFLENYEKQLGDITAIKIEF